LRQIAISAALTFASAPRGPRFGRLAPMFVRMGAAGGKCGVRFRRAGVKPGNRCGRSSSPRAGDHFRHLPPMAVRTLALPPTIPVVGKEDDAALSNESETRTAELGTA
jgi:hypothetical protein